MCIKNKTNLETIKYNSFKLFIAFTEFQYNIKINNFYLVRFGCVLIITMHNLGYALQCIHVQLNCVLYNLFISKRSVHKYCYSEQNNIIT